MPDGKDYVSRPEEKGNIYISEDVLAVIAAAAANEVEGMGGFTGKLGSDLAEQFLGKKNQGKGVHIQTDGDTVILELSILIKDGYSIPEVARAVQDAVMNAVEATSGLTVQAVNVNVSGIFFAKEPPKETH